MKKVVVVLLLMMISAGSVLAQADTLALDENNKFIYYQVVQQPGTTADTLYTMAALFLKKAYPKDRLKAVKTDKVNLTLNASGGVLVSKKSMIAMHEDASVGFNFVVEIKDGKYRYWFTDFVVTPYERDRYANYVPVAGKNYPLEKASGKLSVGDYNGYLKKVLANCREIGAILKSYTKNDPAEVKNLKNKTSVPKEW
jgi:hypothetical protein